MTRIVAFAMFVATWNLSAAQDGRVGDAAEDITAAAPDLDGVWLAAPGTIAAPTQAVEMVGPELPQLTAEGLRIREEYDLFVDDPGYLCSPSSINRVWSNPVPIEIEQHPDRVILRYEYMDAVRTVYLDGRSQPVDRPPEVLGHSVGRYEGSTLIIESTGFTFGYIGTVSGTPQTETLSTVERLTLSDDGQRFRLDIFHVDPATFTTPWISTRDFARRTDLERLVWDCVLEDAGYEEFQDP